MTLPVPEQAILVVEDSDEDYDTVVEAAREKGVRNPLVRAVDADEAMLRFDENRVPGFAFVLLDNNLPGISGCELLGDLRTRPTLRRLPVVVYTTSTSTRDCDACYEAGANAYHVKSVRFDDCLRTLGDVFQYWLHGVLRPSPATAAEQARAEDDRRRNQQLEQHRRDD